MRSCLASCALLVVATSTVTATRIAAVHGRYRFISGRCEHSVGWSAVAATLDECVDAGDERLDVRGEAAVLFDHRALRIGQLALPVDQRPLAVDQQTLPFDHGVEHLLSFEMLFAN